MSDRPPPSMAMKPEFVGGDACDNCWKYIRPHGLLFPNARRRSIYYSGHGRLHFCDDECLESYIFEGAGLYDQGVRYGRYAAGREIAPERGWPDYVE